MLINLIAFFFWIFIAFILYSYLFSPIILWGLARLKQKEKSVFNNAGLPACSIIIPVYRESEILNEKLQNTVSFLEAFEAEIIIVTDEADETTKSILAKYASGIKHIQQYKRTGKMAAMKAGVSAAAHDILVFTDANTLLDQKGIKHLIMHLFKPHVGAVSGEKIISNNEEGLYWKYEAFVKNAEYKCYTTVSVVGEFFAIRKSLFPDLLDNTILDDFMISAKLLQKGYIIAYEPKAKAIEIGSSNFAQEFQRKKRIGAGAAQAIQNLGWIPYSSFWLNLQFYTRKVSRWLILPITLPFIFVLNVLLIYMVGEAIHWIYWGILCLQTVFYLFAFIGLGFKQRNKITDSCTYFLFLHMALLIGFFDYFSGKHTVLWQKPNRKRL